MRSFVSRRLLLMIPTFFGITLVCFILLRMANADPIAADFQGGVTGAQVSGEAIAQLRAIYDLDKPWYVQYRNLVLGMLTLDLGTRWQDGRAIRDVIFEALPITLLLSVSSLILSHLIAIPLGVYSAVRRRSVPARILTAVVFVLYSLPSFWVALMLLTFLGGGVHFACSWSSPGEGCFPLQGWHSFEGFEAMSFGQKIGDVAFHIALPVIALTYNGIASVSSHLRTALIECLDQDFIRAARARGLSEQAVVFKHALRNSLLPLLTLLGASLPRLIAGSAVVEFVFGIPGMGYELLTAIRLPDYPQVISLVAITSLMSMAGTLLADLLYFVVDPRIRTAVSEAR